MSSLCSPSPETCHLKHIQLLEVDRDSKGCIPGTRKSLVSKSHNDNNKITSVRDTYFELPSLQLRNLDDETLLRN